MFDWTKLAIVSEALQSLETIFGFIFAYLEWFKFILELWERFPVRAWVVFSHDSTIANFSTFIVDLLYLEIE